MRGRTYQEVAAAGGGIARTVAATRSAHTDALVDLCARRVTEMMRLGVTTVEAKTGYGLDIENETRLLEVYDAAPTNAACSRRLDSAGSARCPAGVRRMSIAICGHGVW